MKQKTFLLILGVWMTALMAAQAHPTVAGRVKNYNNGVLTIEMEDKSLKKLLISKDTTVSYRGSSSVASLPVGAKISVQVLGSVIANPAKAGKIVDWSNSSQIVAVGAKAPYYTAVGAYASTAGSDGVPDGAPVGNHAASHTLGAVAHGGAINAPTQQNHPVGLEGSQPTSHSSMGQPQQSTQYVNQGVSHSAPLESMGINPYGSGQQATQGGPSAVPNSAGMYGADQAAMQAGMYGMDPAGMNAAQQAGMNPAMYGMDPTAAMNNPYAMSNLGMGQSGHLMGITGDDDDDYSAGGDMMGLGSESAHAGHNKITGSILQVDMQRGVLLIQSFTNPQPQQVFMGPASSTPPDLLIPGKMVEITGQATARGFQAYEIRPASGGF